MIEKKHEEIDEEKNSKSNRYSLPYGLCERYGIRLEKNARPRDAWDALARKGITPEKVYKQLREKEGNKRDTLATKYEENPEFSGQIRIMNNMRNVLSRDTSVVEPITFDRQKDGTVSYQYTTEQSFHKVHGGKMISPDKDDIVKRITIFSGTIAKDGMRIKNQPIKTETIVKRGKR